ncbi:GGDEF domain-containing response regulator [Solemya velesiana gill symbiont]|uniref:diguanylate cyclase n=1 Tax=Solemya velesiana gill symbiont TaxID=1918948 RepID=A0A1T2KT80_9GAMM|nr:diguanylate cyclase [Solemya velesiana gill symbiont]OOZ36068.1 hypothetical protein BOW51_09090 [Solemya velesiana gill symbiont]
MKILLIEGSMDERQSLVSQLQRWGHEVVCANSANESFQLIEQSPPRFIILDTTRPDLDEEKLTQQLRHLIKAYVPIVLLVDSVDPDRILSCIQSGGSDYLLKPVNTNQLKAKILSMQRCSSTMRQLEEHVHHPEQVGDLDETTGVANRNVLDQSLQNEVARCTRYNLPLSAIQIGMDHFKDYNDKYGHLAGDKCLKKIAGILKKEINHPTDLVCRFEEDIFTVLLSDTGTEGALFVAERIFNTIREMAIPHRDNGVSEIVTLSIGVASLFPDPCTVPNQIIDNAHEAMKRTKGLGRARIERYEA